jgi:hypothetical protein
MPWGHIKKKGNFTWWYKVKSKKEKWKFTRAQESLKVVMLKINSLITRVWYQVFEGKGQK